jgi:hypothetical protein
VNLDLSLSNTQLYSGCIIETVAGRLNLTTPVAQAIEILEPSRPKPLPELLALDEADLVVYLAELAMAFGDESTNWEYLQENVSRWVEKAPPGQAARDTPANLADQAALRLQHAQRTLLDTLARLDPRCWQQKPGLGKVCWRNTITGDSIALRVPAGYHRVVQTPREMVLSIRADSERFTLTLAPEVD